MDAGDFAPIYVLLLPTLERLTFLSVVSGYCRASNSNPSTGAYLNASSQRQLITGGAGLVLTFVLIPSFPLLKVLKGEQSGGEGSRTPVLTTICLNIYMLSR